DNLLGTSIAMGTDIHSLILGRQRAAAMKGLVVLRKRVHRATGPIRIVVARIRQAKIGHLSIRRQIGQLEQQIVAPPLLERLLLVFQLVLLDRPVTKKSFLANFSNKERLAIRRL